MRACVVNMHFNMSQEQLFMEIYRKNARAQSEHPDQAPAFTPTVRNPQCGHAVWGTSSIANSGLVLGTAKQFRCASNRICMYVPHSATSPRLTSCLRLISSGRKTKSHAISGKAALNPWARSQIHGSLRGDSKFKQCQKSKAGSICRICQVSWGAHSLGEATCCCSQWLSQHRRVGQTCGSEK